VRDDVLRASGRIAVKKAAKAAPKKKGAKKK
jgi:hypothetical protein